MLTRQPSKNLGIGLVVGKEYTVYITRHSLAPTVEVRRCMWEKEECFCGRGVMRDLDINGVYYHGENKIWHRNYNHATTYIRYLIAIQVPRYEAALRKLKKRLRYG